ncbi:hypothetical protein [Thiothrix eikelboomii]|uniref:hypothetical protein n=1 Tax=Thiothrix eikelboomii TaxID=92487 RepID=UPI003BB07298
MRNISKVLLSLSAASLLMVGCTQETQNQIGRAINNWTGTNGVLEVYTGGKLVRRFVKIDKLSTATGTNSSADRPYRFGNGYLDANLNGLADKEESYVYFEISDYSTQYVFYEAPKVMPVQ